MSGGWGTPRRRPVESRNAALERRQYAPLDVACPACRAPFGQLCTQPTDTGRRQVQWVHSAREDRAQAYSNGWETP